MNKYSKKMAQNLIPRERSAKDVHMEQIGAIYGDILTKMDATTPGTQSHNYMLKKKAELYKGINDIIKFAAVDKYEFELLQLQSQEVLLMEKINKEDERPGPTHPYVVELTAVRDRMDWIKTTKITARPPPTPVTNVVPTPVTNVGTTTYNLSVPIGGFNLDTGYTSPYSIYPMTYRLTYNNALSNA